MTYYLEFFVSLAEASERNVNGFGIYLTNDINDFSNPNIIANSKNYYNLIPQIPNDFPSVTPYSDRAGWTKISGTFTPTVDGIKYVLIGNFSDDFFSDPSNYNGNSEDFPYYFIDDVFLGEFSCCPDEAIFQNTESLPQTTSVNNQILAGSSVDQSQQSGEVIVKANQNVVFKSGNGIFLKPGFSTEEGATFSAVLGECEKGIDDNQLFVIINEESLGNQIRLTAEVANGSGNYNYAWSTGATSSTIVVPSSSQSYTVVVTDNVNDSSATSPCDRRVGWAEFVDNCSFCRSQSVAHRDQTINSNELQEIESETANQMLVVYPNPSSGIFHVFTKGNLDFTTKIAVYNVYGKKVFETIVKSAESQININREPKGVYFLVLSQGKTVTNVRKVLLN